MLCRNQTNKDQLLPAAPPISEFLRARIQSSSRRSSYSSKGKRDARRVFECCVVFYVVVPLCWARRRRIGILNGWVKFPKFVGQNPPKFGWVCVGWCIYRETPMITRGKPSLCASKWPDQGVRKAQNWWVKCGFLVE